MNDYLLTVFERLKKAGVQVIFAAEGGSRAWGFANERSDYDVRYIYVYAPDRYLSVRRVREVLDEHSLGGVLPGIKSELQERDADLVGWDLRKALRLGAKGSMGLYEWLRSPLRYYCHPSFVPIANVLWAQLPTRKLARAYVGLAFNHVKKYKHEVKHVLYILRALGCAACLTKGIAPVVNMPDLITQIESAELMPASVTTAARRLVEAARSGYDGPVGSVEGVKDLALARLCGDLEERVTGMEEVELDNDYLDTIMLVVLRAVWKGTFSVEITPRASVCS